MVISRRAGFACTIACSALIAKFSTTCCSSVKIAITSALGSLVEIDAMFGSSSLRWRSSITDATTSRSRTGDGSEHLAAEPRQVADDRAGARALLLNQRQILRAPARACPSASAAARRSRGSTAAGCSARARRRTPARRSPRGAPAGSPAAAATAASSRIRRSSSTCAAIDARAFCRLVIMLLTVSCSRSISAVGIGFACSGDRSPRLTRLAVSSR